MTTKVEVRVFFQFGHFAVIILSLIIINELLSATWGRKVEYEIALISLHRLQRIGLCGSARDAVGQEPP